MNAGRRDAVVVFREAAPAARFPAPARAVRTVTVTAGVTLAVRQAVDGIIACRICGLVQRTTVWPARGALRCARCDSVLHRHKANSRSRTAAFALAALFFYVPANIYPILRMNYLGRYSESTVWDGVTSLYQQGQWYVATVVFCASILVPLLKLIGLFLLVMKWPPSAPKLQTGIYRVVSVIGPWAMLDVFLLAILVALVKLGTFSNVRPGLGIIPFSAVVILTLLASASFDPQLIWQEEKL